MSTAADDLRQALMAYAPLVSLVGSRVRFDAGDEKDTYPLIVLRQVGDDPQRGIDGSLHVRIEDFQIESWGETRAESSQVHRLVEAALIAAEMEPEAADPDALDPDVGARACVWNVRTWSDT